MARGGYRPGAGRPVGTVTTTRTAKKPAVKQKKVAKAVVIPPVQSKTPREYMLDIVNDETADQARRDRLAIAAAPFVHARAGEGGKKEERAQAAKKASTGKFAPVAAPLRLVK
jgi:hypothetical protein